MDARRAAALSLSYFLDAINRPLRLPGSGMKPEMIWRGSNRAVAKSLKLSPREVDMLTGFRRSFSACSAEKELKREGIRFLAIGEEGYPARLAQVHDPPFGLFVKMGDANGRSLEETLSAPRIAIVGARAASRYGMDAAEMLAAGLAAEAVCVVSGMAMGIDSAAHRGALEGAGDCIAVLGCGVDVIYPAANRVLYRSILDSGAVISEYPPGSRPMPWRFPARNRIIAGISMGVVVVEGREKSGSLITADFCLEQGGEVYAVPGSIFSELSVGPNRLIKEGAAAVTGIEDILEPLGIPTKDVHRQQSETAAPVLASLSEAEKKVLQVLDHVPRHLDILAAESGLDSRNVTGALITLELNGLAWLEPGQGYCRRHGR